MNTQKLGYFLV